MSIALAKPFMIVRPVTIGAAQLYSSNVAELDALYDYPAWNAATVYAIGDKVARATSHHSYQRRTNGATAGAPESDTTNWLDIGPTNRHAMFDGSYQSITQNAHTIEHQVIPGDFVDTCVVLNAHAASINLQVEGTAYDRTATMCSRDVENWWDFWYEPFAYRENYAFFGLPMGLTRKSVLTIDNTGSLAQCGEVIWGLSKQLGGSMFGARSWLLDYSVKVTDEFGNTTAEEGPYALGMSVDVVVKAGFVDELRRTLRPFRAKRAVYIAAGNLFESLMTYGFFESLEVVHENSKEATCNFRIQGVT
jgi:hypothetical protein